MVIDNTGKLGVLRSQAKINLSFRAAICIVYCAYGYYYVTSDINLVVACANHFAISILNSIHVNRTAGCINCAIAVFLIGINNIDLAAVNVNGCSADVSKQAVADAGDIYIAVDVNRTACSAVACMCINACSAVFVEAAAVAVKSYLYIAVNGGAACMAVNAYGRVIALNIDIYIAINCQIAFVLMDCVRSLTTVLAIELNNQLVSLHGAVCIYVLCNACITLAGISYINSQSFAAGINSSVLNKIHALSAFTAYVDSTIFRKFIAAVLNYAAHYIFQILQSFACQGGVKGLSSLVVRFIGKFDIISGAALTGFFAEADIAGYHGYAVAGQTACQLNITFQVTLAAVGSCIIQIGQLACQCVQCCADIGYALIGGNHINNRACFRMLDNGIACSIAGAVTVMSVDDVGNTAVIINSQAVAVILINVACCFSSCAACQLVDTAASELFTLIYVCQSSLLLISPGCTVLQPQVCCTGKELLVAALRCCLAAFREFVIDYAAQLGILRRQAQIYQRILIAVNIVYCAYRYYYVTGNINLIISSTDYIALFILHGVHVDSTAGCIDCAVACCSIIINNVDLAAIDVNRTAADVSKQAVAYAGDINIAVDVNRTAYCSTIACMCINACCAIFCETTVVAVQLNLHVAVNRRAACMAVYAYGRVIALNIDVNVTINRQIAFVLMDCVCTLSALTTVELNHELVYLNRTVCIYILVNARVSLAGISYVDSQSFAAGINRRAFSKVRALSAFAAYVDSTIFGKFIATVFNYAAKHIFQILILVAG